MTADKLPRLFWFYWIVLGLISLGLSCLASDVKDMVKNEDVFNILNLKSTTLKKIVKFKNDGLFNSGKIDFLDCEKEKLEDFPLNKTFGGENSVFCEFKDTEISKDFCYFQQQVSKYLLKVEFGKEYWIKDISLTLDNAYQVSQVLLFTTGKDYQQTILKEISSGFPECDFMDNSSSSNNHISNNNCVIKKAPLQYLFVEQKLPEIANGVIVAIDFVGEKRSDNCHPSPTVKDLVISARCKCAGKSTRCQLNSIDNKTPDDDELDVLKCQCIEGWSGENCDQCAHGFRKNIKGDVSTCEAQSTLHSRQRKKRQACTCDQVGTFYNLCNPLPAHNYRCICKRGYSGKYCNKCSSLSFGYPRCKACACDIFSSLVSKCNDKTGQCDCKNKITGRTCNRCVDGFYRHPLCSACDCPKTRTKAGICDKKTGACLCADKYEGEKCQVCKPGHYAFPECKACECSSVGSKSATCNARTGSCDCEEGFTGLHCNSCRDKNLIYPNCLAAPTTEKPKITTDFIPDCKLTNSCPTQPPKHPLCADLFFNDTESRVSSCVPCGCFGEGTISSLLNCNKLTGKCACKNHVGGKACSRCQDGYFALNHNKIFGCSACQCDVGGSQNANCDRVGNCRCRNGITGKKCDRVKDGEYFLPHHFQMKFEFERSKLKNGDPVSFRFSEAEFPKFTWKGYVPLGQEHADLYLRIDVPKTTEYRLLFRYVLLSNEPASAEIEIYQLPKKDSQIFTASVSFSVNRNSIQRNQYAEADQHMGVRLEKGQWQLHISSDYPGLLLDHVLLMPKEYYNPKTLLQPKPKPCSVAVHRHAICSMYQYLSFDTQGFHTVQGNAGLVVNSRGSTRASAFDDPDVIRQLKADYLATLSPFQRSITFNMVVQETGDYIVVVEYFSADERSYRVGMMQDGGTQAGHWIATSCPYRFLCRSVVIDSSNVPLKVRFRAGERKSLKMVFDSIGMLGIHSVTAIPSLKFTNEYLKPKFHCMMGNGKCLSYARFPSLDHSMEMKNHSTTENITSSNPGKFSIDVKEENWWTVVIEFQQSKYPEFIAQLTLASTGYPSHFNVRLEFCPSETGCRVKVAYYAYKGKLKMLIQVPQGKEVKINSVYLITSDNFNERSLQLDHVDVSAEYLRVCVDENKLPIPNTIHSICRDAFFSQISAFNNGASSCDCHPRGSIGRKCEKNGGQCKCKRNIIGGRCQSCRTGFYNFPYCRSCRCFMAGSLSPECGRNGKCRCKPQYGGLKCDKCKSSHFYAFPECKPCNCDSHGSLSLYCGSSTGQCSCLTNFRSRSCNQCQIGFHSFPKCSKCDCNAAGIAVTKDQPNGCNPGRDGRCSCKKNVAGRFCDRCKDFFFNLQISNPLGCTPCKCNTAGTLNGIATCSKDSNGRCYCKPNIDEKSRTCDSCKDGFFNLSFDDVFGCKACDCNKGGSLSQVCDKKSGQCKCRPNVTGRKCDRLISSSYYIPTIQHLFFDDKNRIDKTNQLLRSSDTNNNNDKNHHVYWKINAPKRSKYVLVFGYKIEGGNHIDVDISLIYAYYGSLLYQSKQQFNSSSNSSSIKVASLQENGKETLLDLFEGSYEVQLSSNSNVLQLEYITLIPESYLSGEALSSVIQEPCSVHDSSKPCLKYTYLSVPRKGVVTIELESMRGSGGQLFDQAKYPSLNINGAVLVRFQQNFMISFNQAASGSFIFLLSYFNPLTSSSKLLINVQGPEGVQTGIARFARCAYVFPCRQTVLDDFGKLRRFQMQKGRRYHVSFLLMSVDEVALDFLAMVPETEWNQDFIKPTLFCSSINQKCVKNELELTDDHIVLKASDSVGYKKPRFLPPNVLDASTKLIHLESENSKSQMKIAWNMPIKGGFFYPILHYYQPYDETIVIKAIVYTPIYAVAGKLRLAFCPHVTGCKTPLVGEEDLNSKEPIRLFSNNVGIILHMPKNRDIWIDHLLFIRTYSYEDNLLQPKPISFSTEYKNTCLQNYKLQHPLTKQCIKWLFQLSLWFNGRPIECNCKIKGAENANCNLIGGQCKCKNHVIGRTCSRCDFGFVRYPRCIKIDKRNF